MSKLNVDHLSDRECQRILGVLQRDYHLRNRERIRIRPEDTIPTNSSKPPKPPRSYLHASQPAGLNTASTAPSLRQSLEQFTSPASGTNGSDYKRRYGSEYSLNLNNNHDDSYFSSPREDINEMYLRRIDAYQRKYGSHSSLYGSTSSLASAGAAATPGRFCSQCGDQLSPNAKRRAECCICKQWICKLCAAWEPRLNSYICEQHEHEEGIEEYNRNSTDWTYDVTEKKFVRTKSGGVADSLVERLSGGSQTANSVGKLQDLSLAEFDKTVGLHQPQQTASELPPNQQTEALQNPANQIRVENFFSASPKPDANTLISVDLSAKLSQLEEELSHTASSENECEGTTFEELRDTETKSFLTEIDKLVKKITVSWQENDSKTNHEELLSYHRSSLSALIANLEQSLHLAVDRQSSPTLVDLVKHSDVASVVCTTITAYTGEKLPEEVLPAGGDLNYGAAANALLSKITESLKLPRGAALAADSASSGFLARAAENSQSSEHGSYKLPSFSHMNGNHDAVDPDALSLSCTSAVEPLEEVEEEVMSEGSSQWDTDSVARRNKRSSFGFSSSNWFFRSKVPQPDEISSRSNIFNHLSTSEESLTMYVPEQRAYTADRDSDNASDLTLGSGSVTSDLLSGDAADPLTPRFDETLMDDPFTLTKDSENNYHKANQIMPRGQPPQSGGSASRDSDSRKASLTSTVSATQTLSGFTEDGEESTSLKFSLKPRSQSIPRGDVAKFTCSVMGNGHIDVYWFKEEEDDSVSIETDDKYEISSHDDKHTLEIYNVTQSDYGQYLCLARNDTTSSHWLFGLDVEESSSYEEKTPLFLKELQDTEALEGEAVRLRCKVRAYPPPRVIWFKDGKKLQNGDNYKIEKFGNRDYMLTINHVTADHDAEFTVVARNCAGEAKSTAQLLVETEAPVTAQNGKPAVFHTEPVANQTRAPKPDAVLTSTPVKSKPAEVTVSTKVESKPSPATTSPIHSTGQPLVAPQTHFSPSTPSVATIKDMDKPQQKGNNMAPGVSSRRSLRAAMKRDDPLPGSSNLPASSKPEHVKPDRKSEVKLLKVTPLNTDSPVKVTPSDHRHGDRSSTSLTVEPVATSSKSSEQTAAQPASETGVHDAKSAGATSRLNTKAGNSPKEIKAATTNLTSGSGQDVSSPDKSAPARSSITADPSPGKVHPTGGSAAHKTEVVVESRPMSPPRLVSDPSSERTAHQHNSDKSTAKPNTQQAEAINKSSSAEIQTTERKPDRKNLPTSERAEGVDIKPGHVREKQYALLGDASKIKPSVSLKKASSQAKPDTHSVKLFTRLKPALTQGLLPDAKLTKTYVKPEPNNNSYNTRITEPSNHSPASSASAAATNTMQKPAPQPPAATTVNLRGTTTPDSIPSSRGEWEHAIPSVLQRCQSFTEQETPSRDSQGQKDDSSTGKTTQPETKRPTSPKRAAPQPPVQPSPTSSNNASPGGEKAGKRVVKRTVSVKRSIIPASQTTFGDGPPNDGHDYIKICGRWVQMKKAQSQHASAGAGSGTSKAGRSSPPPKAEWSGELQVDQKMKEFKREQETNGKIITGRNMGPITSV